MALALPSWAARRPWIAIVLGCATLGLLVGWLAVTLPSPESAPDQRDTWQLPSKAELDRYDGNRFQALVRAEAWPPSRNAGGRKTGADGQAATGDRAGWTLVGIVTDPEPYALVLENGSAQTRRLGVGARLADGAVIQHIGKEAIELSSGACQRQVRLFHVDRQDKAVACGDNPDTAAPAGAGEQP